MFADARWIALALGLALAASGTAAQQRLRYEDATGGARSSWTMAVERAEDGGEKASVEYASGASWRFELDSGLATRSCSVSSPGGTALSLRREGDSIFVGGERDGRPVAASLALDGSAWIETFKLGLAPFALGVERSMDFWTVDADKLKAFRMTASLAGRASLDAGGSSWDAVRVRVTAAGVPALFYHVDYWFRAADGRFLRSEGARGSPGSPKTVTSYQGGD